jgi:ribonuclease HII
MIGIDEVGRGCLAGPLLIVAALQISELSSGLKDSKLLTRNQREEYYKKLNGVCRFGEGWVTAREIDRRGLAGAMRLGVARALKALSADRNEAIIIDGKVNYCPKPFKNTRCIVKADSLVPLVSAASIYAKVRRDNFMRQLKARHPGYGFEAHVGYGTAQHRLAISTLGPIKAVHRMSFKPLYIF